MKTAPRARGAIIAEKRSGFPQFGVPALAGAALGAPALSKWSATGIRSARRLKTELQTVRSAEHCSARIERIRPGRAMLGAPVVLFTLALLLVSVSSLRAGEPVNPVEFRRARITDAWEKYASILTFGRGQTLALVDDGCKLAMPAWTAIVDGVPKVRVAWDAVDGDPDPKHEGRGYHGSTIGIPSSLNLNGKWGVAYNNQVAVIRGLECCHCKIADSAPLARALQWIIDHHAEYRITTVNLAPVDDLAHSAPVPTEIDAPLAKLRELGIWVSAPAGNHHFTNGISWPASQPNCFAIGAVKPGVDLVILDRDAKIVLVVPASATSSSNAIACGAAMILREAIERSGYQWKIDGKNLPEAMLAIFQKTGKPVPDPATKLTFRRLDLLAALDHVMKKP